MKNSSINNNSIWPNGLMTDTDGYWTFTPLGENKHNIPTGITETEVQEAWPKGDVLISPFVYKDGKLVGFCDTKALDIPRSTDPDSTDVTVNTLMPYEYIQVEFTSLEKDDIVIYAPYVKTLKVRWKNTDSFETILGPVKGGGTFTYAGCANKSQVMGKDPNYLENIVDGTWSEKLWDLTDGTGFFDANAKSIIKTFNSDLPSLTANSGQMFRNCTKLTTFNGDLSSLQNGTFMFENCNNLSTFNCNNLNSLTNAHHMFDDCLELTTFSYELKNLENGNCMFGMGMASPTPVYGKLVSFNSDLRALKCAGSMFYHCKLDAASVQNIVSTIKYVKDVAVDADGKINITGVGPVTAKTITIGMNCSSSDEADRKLFAQEAGYDNMDSIKKALEVKGWTASFQYNKNSTTTYSLRRPSENTLPVFVKLEEDDEHDYYMSEDGSKKYRLDWFHETTGSTDGYTQFNTIEEAIESLNIKPVEN